MKRDLKKILDDACERGWRVELTNSGHWRLTGPNRALLFTASTPGDWRGIRNIRQAIRRAERGPQQ
jgi:hypothetical protein